MIDINNLIKTAMKAGDKVSLNAYKNLKTKEWILIILDLIIVGLIPLWLHIKRIITKN